MRRGPRALGRGADAGSAVDPAERHLLVTPTDGPDVYVMTVDVDELLEIARSRVTRDLTDEECQTYLHVDACPSD